MSTPRKVLPYGSWPSPVTAEATIAGQLAIGQIAVDGSDLYWTEARPTEGGRTAIVRRDRSGRIQDVLPPPWSSRSRVYEYGGGSFCALAGTVVFSNDADRRLYAVSEGGEPRPVTPSGPWSYGDLVWDAPRARLLAVREDRDASATEPLHTLAAIGLGSEGPGEVLVSGSDFYASPRLSADGRRLCWLSWEHPNMPWDETRLWVGELTEHGRVASPQLVAGGDGESIFQPEWSPSGLLCFASDRSGWWNLHAWSGGEPRPLHPIEAEVGLPQWNLGMTTYAFCGEASVVCAFCERGLWRLATLDLITGRWHEVATPYVAFPAVRAREGRAVLVAASPSEPPTLVELDLTSHATRVLRRAGSPPPDAASLSVGEPVSFPTTDGETAHAIFYRPRNDACTAPAGELPPLRVRSHGGPTAASDASYKPSIQFWTSRGFAVLDVNYRGSTGYGRAYREKLAGAWGVADVDDCVSGALSLVSQRLVDPRRLTISGGSAGGYTTLCALAFRDVFRAGASYYGIGDLSALARETHKFESRYLDRLVAPWPEGEAIYRARSPLFHPDGLSCPVVFFQGLEDRVVPPSQAEAMVAVLRAKRLPVAYLTFAGEAHGFRRSETLRRCLEVELAFFARVLGFDPADLLPPVEIENL